MAFNEIQNAGAFQRLRTAFDDAGSLAKLIERGQAANPLTEHFISLGRELDEATFRGHVLSISEQSSWKVAQVPGLFSVLHKLPPIAASENVDVITRVAKESHLLVLAGDTEEVLSDFQVKELTGAIEAATIVVGIQFVSNKSARPSKAEWANQILPNESPILAISFPLEGNASLFEKAFKNGSLATACIGLYWARRYEMALQMLENRLDSDSRTLTGRRRILTYRYEQAEVKTRERNLREAGDSIRSILDDQIGRLTDELVEKQKLRCTTGSKQYNSFDNFVEDFAIDNLTFERKSQRELVRLDTDLIKVGQQSLLAFVIDDVSKDIDFIKQRMFRLIEQVQTKLATTGSSVRPIVGLDTENNVHVQSLEKLITLDLRTQSELPKKTIIDRLNYGRRPVFLVMTLASLIGAAFGARGGFMIFLAPIMLVLFIVGVFWTYRSFSFERQDHLERLLAQMRESARIEFRRVYEVVTREWQSRVKRILADSNREIVRQVNVRIQEAINSQAKQQEVDRLEIRESLRIIDGRLRELGTAIETTSKLLRIAIDCQSNFRNILHKIVDDTR